MLGYIFLNFQLCSQDVGCKHGVFQFSTIHIQTIDMYQTFLKTIITMENEANDSNANYLQMPQETKKI